MDVGDNRVKKPQHESTQRPVYGDDDEKKPLAGHDGKLRPVDREDGSETAVNKEQKLLVEVFFRTMGEHRTSRTSCPFFTNTVGTECRIRL